MGFEDVLETVGSWGRFQRLLSFVLVPATTGLCAFTFYSQLFILTPPPHTCRQPPAPTPSWHHTHHHTTPHPELLELPDTSYHVDPSCHRWDLNMTSDGPTSCDLGWDYDTNAMFPTLASKNDWVCDDAWRNYLMVTLFWVGNTVGSWVWGITADMYGRKPVLLLIHLVYGAAGVASVFVSDFYGFAALRFLVGFNHHTVTHLPYVLGVEWCGPESRVMPLLAVMVSYTVASMAAPLLAWALWDWRALALATAIPPLLYIFTYRWVPESAGWQMAKGQLGPATQQLVQVARINKRKGVTSEELHQQLVEATAGISSSNKSGKDSILDVAKMPNLRKAVGLVLLVWMVSCLCYYGHCQYTTRLAAGVFTDHMATNMFLSFLLGAAVEVPAWSAPFLINRFGRRLPLTAALTLSGVASLLYVALPVGTAALVVALVARSGATAGYYITLQYGPEVFPTVVRGQGVALAETLGGVAIFTSPSLVYLGEVWGPLPMLVFGSLSAVAGVVTVLLPETNGVTLPQSLPEAEKFCHSAARACCRSQLREVEAPEPAGVPLQDKPKE